MTDDVLSMVIFDRSRPWMTKEGKACNPLFESKILGGGCLEHVQWQVEKTSGPGSTRRSRSRPVEAGGDASSIQQAMWKRFEPGDRVDELPFCSDSERVASGFSLFPDS